MSGVFKNYFGSNMVAVATSNIAMTLILGLWLYFSSGVLNNYFVINMVAAATGNLAMTLILGHWLYS